MSSRDFFVKRLFDLLFSTLLLIPTLPLIILAWLVACVDTRMNGFFLQKRVGQYGRIFRVIKIRTMMPGSTSSVTSSSNLRITKVGSYLRKTKIDELPQLFNVLIGQMSFVGPRPDVPGFADRISGKDRVILLLKPGITSPASLKYRNEEALLSLCGDPELYNAHVIWPDKVGLNLDYYYSWSFLFDLRVIIATLLCRGSF